MRTVVRPASVIRTRDRSWVLLEGHPEDCVAQARRAGLAEAQPPSLPEGVRLAVPPARIDTICARIAGEYAAEIGVGIIHATPRNDDLAVLRTACEALGGRMLVLRRGTGVAPFGRRAGNEHDRRVKLALDPHGLFAPWRFAA